MGLLFKVAMIYFFTSAMIFVGEAAQIYTVGLADNTFFDDYVMLNSTDSFLTGEATDNISNIDIIQSQTGEDVTGFFDTLRSGWTAFKGFSSKGVNTFVSILTGPFILSNYLMKTAPREIAIILMAFIWAPMILMVGYGLISYMRGSSA